MRLYEVKIHVKCHGILSGCYIVTRTPKLWVHYCEASRVSVIPRVHPTNVGYFLPINVGNFQPLHAGGCTYTDSVAEVSSEHARGKDFICVSVEDRFNAVDRQGRVGCDGLIDGTLTGLHAFTFSLLTGYISVVSWHKEQKVMNE